MISEPPDYDPITIWQNQKEHSTPSLEEVLVKAREFDTKNRRGAFIFWIALILHIALSVAEDVAGVKVWWVGVIRFALLMVWVAYIPFKSKTDDVLTLSLRDTGLTPVFDFYRRQLDRRRDFFQDDSRRVTQWVVLGISFTLYSLFYPSIFLVFCVPLAICGALFYKRRRGELSRIQQEIETLDRLRKE